MYKYFFKKGLTKQCFYDIINSESEGKRMQMICDKTVGKEVTIDSNNLYDYIGLMPAHTKISQKDLLTIFKCVLFLDKQKDEVEEN